MNWFREKLKHRRILKFYKELLPLNALCFDVGAHQGEVSLYLLKAGMKVVGIEPLSECVEGLTDIKARYNDSFSIVSMGVAATKEERFFYKANLMEVSTFSKEFIDAYSKYDYLSWEEPELVNCTTLKELISQHGVPYFIKLDMEGYELEAIKSLNQPIRVLQFEWNQLTIEVAIAVVEHLKLLGEYKYNWWPREQYRLVERDNLSPEGLIKKLYKEKDIWLTGEIVAFLEL